MTRSANTPSASLAPASLAPASLAPASLAPADIAPADIAVAGLAVSAGAHRLVGPVDFTLAAGGILVIMGETGAGKSLMAQAILGALPPGLSATGAVRLGGQRIDGLTGAARTALWGRHIALLPQEPWRALDPLMTAAPQVAETHRLVAGLSRPAAAAAVRQDFAALGLAGAGHRLPGALSGGMAQRVAFAAAKAGGGRLLIADEPTKGLDAHHRQAVIDLLAGHPAAGGTAAGGSLIAITHDVTVARRLGGDLMILKDGAVVEAGPTAAVLAAPRTDYGRALVAAAPEAWPRPPACRPGEPVLQADGIAIDRGGRRLIDGLDLMLRAGERLAVSGPSGTGKTSLLDVLAGSLRPTLGTVRRGAGVGRTGVQKLYQDPPAAFPPRLTLRRALGDVARRHRIDPARIATLLQRLAIDPGLLDRRPDAVSGGELQRIALVRVLCLRPAVLLADEPTSRLDPVTQADTMALIAAVAADSGIAVVLVTHDDAIADRWADRRLVLG